MYTTLKTSIFSERKTNVNLDKNKSLVKSYSQYILIILTLFFLNIRCVF